MKKVERNISVNLKMIKEKAKEYFIIIMVINTMANLKMMPPKAMEFIFGVMGINI